MKKKYLLLLVCFFVSAAYAFDGHTPPNKWEKPRIYHEPIKDGGMISTSCVELEDDQVLGSLHFSKNEAYWFFYTQSTTKQNIRNLKIYIYNETGCGPLITIENIYREPDIHWINEKLLYVQVWYGRREGEYFIYDVEKGEFVIRERVIWGQIEFEQYEEGCRKFPENCE